MHLAPNVSKHALTHGASGTEGGIAQYRTMRTQQKESMQNARAASAGGQLVACCWCPSADAPGKNAPLCCTGLHQRHPLPRRRGAERAPSVDGRTGPFGGNCRAAACRAPPRQRRRASAWAPGLWPHASAEAGGWAVGAGRGRADGKSRSEQDAWSAWSAAPFWACARSHPARGARAGAWERRMQGRWRHES